MNYRNRYRYTILEIIPVLGLSPGYFGALSYTRLYSLLDPTIRNCRSIELARIPSRRNYNTRVSNDVIIANNTSVFGNGNEGTLITTTKHSNAIFAR